MFTPRLTKDGIYLNEKWYSTQNPYFAGTPLPNCTTYAFGRFWEVNGRILEGLGHGNGGEWWGTTDTTKLSVGNLPKLGAIACWGTTEQSPTDKVGHVAVVEQINNDGSIVISESGWVPFNERTYPIYNMSKYFWIETLTPQNNYCDGWFSDSDHRYYFQGFIYPKIEIPVPDSWMWYVTNQDPSQYLPANYRENNALLIYHYFSLQGWTLEAICGLLGNWSIEGVLNPAQLEYGSTQYPIYDQNTGIALNAYFYPDRSDVKGLGLAGWTQAPNRVLQESIDTQTAWYDGDMQCGLVIYWAQHGDWFPSSTHPQYNYSFYDFWNNTYALSVEELASAFCWEYERPSEQYAHEDWRRNSARQWYEFFNGYIPPTPPKKKHKMPLWMMIRYY